MRPINIALIQRAASANPAQNREKTALAIREAKKKGAQIVCLEELYASRYFCDREDHDTFALAESIPGPSTDLFSALAREHELVLIVPLFEKRAPGLYHNSAVVIDADGTLLGTYRKMHIPDDPEYYEKFYFTPGDLGFKTFKTRYATLGVLICWDQWFPEGARLTALRGAEVLFFPTAIGWHNSQSEELNRIQQDAWEIIQRSHAVANGVYVASANRVGIEGNQKFWGSSFIAGPSGEILAKASVDKDEILMATCDLNRIDETRVHWPFLRDRRIEAYGELGLRFNDE